MSNNSARDSSTKIQRWIYPDSRATTRHSVTANHIYHLSSCFFSYKGFHIKVVSIIDGASRISADALGGQMQWSQLFQQYWGAFSWLSRRSVLWFSLSMTELILFFSGGLGLEIVVLPCSLLNGLFSSFYLPCALKHRQSQAFSDLAKVELWAGRVWGAPDSGLRLLVLVVAGGYWKKHSSVDGHCLPHLWEAAWMFAVGATVKDWPQLKACRAKEVVLMGHCHVCHCPSPVVALVPAVPLQLQRNSSLQFTAPVLSRAAWWRCVGVGCSTGMDAHAMLDAHLSGRPTISLGARKCRAGLLSQRGEDALTAARGSRKGTKLQEQECWWV